MCVLILLRSRVTMSALAAAITAITPPNVSYIQMDSLVIMKIVKHVDSELYAGMSEVAGEACQGLLTGLVSVEKDDSRLEITNCFPTARAEPVLESDENAAQVSLNCPYKLSLFSFRNATFIWLCSSYRYF
ncbi:unnamed protein product [Cylicostephanus goldi]|uniref:JAB1/MPN/MOV34 metalloenzyme domain-containing protein n=1 Tax=Cylicostephanus goldi TaxID=71465 RepID=A0A3P6S9X7_CYLGO|nr:unnamed protein product [Cylicostephanus goldi]